MKRGSLKLILILNLFMFILIILFMGNVNEMYKRNIKISSYNDNNLLYTQKLESGIDSEIYNISDGYISKILPETTLRDLKNNLDNNQIEVYSKEEKLISDENFVGTGMTLKINQEYYKLVVMGDTTGDGKVELTDLVQVNLSVIGLRELVGEKQMAADMDFNGHLSITDVVRVNLALEDIIDVKAPHTFIPVVTTTQKTINIHGLTLDDNSGVKEYWFEINNDGWIQSNDMSKIEYTFKNLIPNTEYTVRMKVTDNAGNTLITERVLAKTLEQTEEPEIYAKLYRNNSQDDTAGNTLVFRTTDWVNPDNGVTVIYPSGYTPTDLEIIINDKTQSDVVKNYGNIYGEVYNSSNLAPWYEDRESITNVIVAEASTEIKPMSTAYWFFGLENVTKMNLNCLDTSDVTDMSYMFHGCAGIESLDLNMLNFDTSNVTDMLYMFYGCRALKELDLSNFNTSNVTSMAGMFNGCSSLIELDLSSFDSTNISNVEDFISSDISKITFGDNWKIPVHINEDKVWYTDEAYTIENKIELDENGYYTPTGPIIIYGREERALNAFMANLTALLMRVSN